MKTKYITLDGIEFDTEEDALEHENSIPTKIIEFKQQLTSLMAGDDFRGEKLIPRKREHLYDYFYKELGLLETMWSEIQAQRAQNQNQKIKVTRDMVEGAMAEMDMSLLRDGNNVWPEACENTRYIIAFNILHTALNN